MTLTDKRVKSAQPKARPYKLADGEGMYLLVKPDGGKYWRLKYRSPVERNAQGKPKEKLLALGVYPEVSIADARQQRAAQREILRSGRDPGAERKTVRRAAVVTAGNTFESIGREWFDSIKGTWSESHRDAVLARLEDELFPKIGPRPIADVSGAEVLEVIRTIEKRDALEWASKTLIVAGQVFRYGVATGRINSDPTRDLRGALKRREVQHYARLKEADLPEFLEKLATYDGSEVTKLAMELLMLTWVRTVELRMAKWAEEIDFEKAEWRIPAERMKGRVEHIVPLPPQAIAVLRKLQALTGGREHLFPNEHRPREVMSENTILFALYRMGYRGRATGHGFRATASTILNEQGWNRDWIERQLAHKGGDEVREAYNAAQYLAGRRKMLAHWADYLDGIRRRANVTSIKKAA